MVMIMIFILEKLDQTSDTKFYVSFPHIPKGILFQIFSLLQCHIKNWFFDSKKWSCLKNVPALVWAWCDTLLGHMVGATRRSSPVGISVGSPPPAPPCWLNYSQHRWRETGVCKSPADWNKEKTFPACVDSTDSCCNHWFHKRKMAGVCTRDLMLTHWKIKKNDKSLIQKKSSNMWMCDDYTMHHTL